ncbi:transmembrane protein 71 [Otolemur garnettii]|uniref:transmembrane protein 71 n=1 Tax=Otolemur garnettii TaxID=30611 RepID=UPI0006446226|nr:transmembrane protein 71 [Otolemur garnettii]
MYRISQLMSTPAASSSRLDRECAGELSATCISPSFSCDFLDGDSSFECCSVDPLTGFHYICRRSPRLLTNGYYVWTEDSFLCDADGNVTLNPSQTRVMYKENLVRIFRKKKKIRHSLPSLFNLRASKSWLHGSFFGDVDSASEDVWLEEVRRLDTDHCNGNETSLSQEVSFRAILLAVCLVSFACARWFMEGMLASVFTCLLLVMVAYAAKSLFFSLASYFKATTYIGFAKI